MSDWDGIEEVVAVADAGSFAGGARAIGVSASHISRAIAGLEARLRAPIFFRTTRMVNLTDTGRSLVDQFRRIIQDRDEALALAGGDAEPQGELRITCSTTLGERFVAPIIRRFAIRYPLLSITIDLTNRVVDLVSEGYDLAVRTGHLNDSRLVASRIASRRLLLCAAPDYILGSGEPVCIADLDKYECLVGTASTWHFMLDGKDVVYRPRGRWHCNNGAATLDAALAGMGLCQLPEFYVRPYLGHGLTELLTAHRAAVEPIWAVYSQRRHLTPKVRLLVAALRQELDPSMREANFAATWHGNERAMANHNAEVVLLEQRNCLPTASGDDAPAQKLGDIGERAESVA